jgi:hypothetical protein
MSTRLVYECDVCKKTFPSLGYLNTLENDVFMLKKGFDICFTCYDGIAEVVNKYIENKEWGGNAK